MRRRALLAALVLCAGCASMTPADEESLAEAQAFSEAVTREYQIAPLRIVPGTVSGSLAGFRQINVSPALLSAPLPVRDAHVARLIAFWIVEPPDARSEPHEETINRRLYPAANVVAVNVLTRVKGLPQSIAVATVHSLLLAQVEAFAENRGAFPPRFPHPCEQLRAFVLHFREHELDGAPGCS